MTATTSPVRCRCGAVLVAAEPDALAVVTAVTEDGRVHVCAPEAERRSRPPRPHRRPRRPRPLEVIVPEPEPLTAAGATVPEPVYVVEYPDGSRETFARLIPANGAARRSGGRLTASTIREE